MFQALQRNHHGSGGHCQPDEGCANKINAEQQGDSEADAERHYGPHHRDAHRSFQGLIEFERLSLDAGVKHQEENTDLGQ